MDRPPEFADIPDEFRAMSRAQLELFATPALNRFMAPEKDRVTRARAELVWRNQEFEREMSAEADTREASRQKFDDELAQRQMDHASKLAKEQLDTAQAAARAATMAACAAGVAALGAIGQIIVALVK
jgi:hypothetical protein